MEKNKQTILKIVHGVSFLSFLYFAYNMMKNNILPENYRIYGLGAILLFYLVFGAITYFRDNNLGVKVVLGLLFAILAAAFLFASNYINKGVSTIGKMNENSKTEKTEFSLVVMKDSDIQGIDQLNDKEVYSALEQDKDFVDSFLVKLKKEKNIALNLVDGKNYLDISKKLLDKEAQVILLNESYRSIIQDADGLTEFEEKTRVLEEFVVEKIVDPEELKAAQELEAAELAEAEKLAEEKFGKLDNLDNLEWETGEDPNEGEKPVNEEDPNIRYGNYRGFALYISGIDSYGGVYASGRSDVNLVLSINPSTRRIVISSIPRDAYVRIAGGGRNQYDKLTHSGIYGINSSRTTMQNLYGIPIKYYARVNFNSVIRLVDVLGGINVYNPVSFNAGGHHFAKGNIHLNGRQALAFSRERKTLASGDMDRGRNQMRVIQGMINKAISPSILTNYNRILDVIMSSSQTNIPSSMLINLVNSQISNGGSWSFAQATVSGYGSMNKRSYAMPGWRLYMFIPYQSSIDSVAGMLYRNMK